VSQLRRRESELKQLDIQVIVITFDVDFLARAYVRETSLKWPLLADPQRTLYSGYGFLRGSLWDLYNPVSIAKYIGVILRGQRPGRPGADWHQLGGDVLIDPNGVVRLLHKSLSPHDRPSIESILKTARS
jgi:alkyl hydroperoxide reductase subunit AhpC